MAKQIISEGNRAVVITKQDSQVFARLYVNAKDGIAHASATPMNWTGKTVSGAERWARKVM